MDYQAVAQILGNYGEFVGAIAVVITLIYLAKQVRSASEATKALVRQHATDITVRTMMDEMLSPRILDAQSKMRKGQSLTEDEAFLLGQLQHAHFRDMEGRYLSHRAGYLDEGDWEKTADMIRGSLEYNEHARAMWKFVGFGWHPAFRSEVDRIFGELRDKKTDSRAVHEGGDPER